VAPRLELRELSRAFGPRQALTSLSFSLEAGERLAIVGPSGSGKSTLLKLLAGSLAPSAGRLLFDGSEVRSLTSDQLRCHRAACGIVEQNESLIAQLDVHRNVIAGLLPDWPWYRSLAGLLWPVERARVGSLLGALGLADRQWDRVSELSGGQQQRVAIGRALIGKPRLIVADEPTASLDPSTAREVLGLLCDQARACGATLVVATHQLERLRSQVDRVIGLRQGRLVFDLERDALDEGQLERLYEAPDASP